VVFPDESATISSGSLALEAAEALWGVVANVVWEDMPTEWVAAAKRARDLYHRALNEARPAEQGKPDVVLPSIEQQVLDVLRNDYRMLLHVAKDRLAALAQAFPEEPPT
jgi:hypothetical protein